VAKAHKAGLTTTTDATKKCVFSQEDSSSAPRVVMKCGHPITPDAIKDYTEGLVLYGSNSDSWPFVIACPSCKTPWDYSVWSVQAQMTIEEKNAVAVGLSKNFMKSQPDIKCCPHCKGYAEVPTTGANRCYCGHCRKPFCRLCAGVMGTSGISAVHCVRCENINSILEKSGTVKVINVDVRKIRACPGCRVLIEHSGTGCKHAKCTSCAKNFCFLCLQMPTGAVWPTNCGGPFSVCQVPIAPLQQF